METVTITNTFFDECKETKWMEGWKFKTAYRPFNRTAKVGNMAYLYSKYDRPTTTKEFYEKYISDTTDNVSLEKKGRTEEELIKFAEEYKQNYEAITKDTSIPLDTFYKNLVFHFFTQTITGHQAEEELTKIINEKYDGYTASPVDYILDTKYGIDIEVNGDNGNKFFLQVKPISFIVGKNPSEDLKKDREALIYKRCEALKDYGYNTYYVFYKKKDDGHLEWLVRNKKITHTLNQILDNNGNSIFTYDNTTWK